MTRRIGPDDDPHNRRPFHGAKAALFLGERLVLIRRDERPDIPWPGRLDLPGGGRETGESGWQTICRETEEEIGLDLAANAPLWARRYPAWERPLRQSWFFVVSLPPAMERAIALGEEGQSWRLMPAADYLARDDAIPPQQARLADWLRRKRSAPALSRNAGA